jgi:TonB family protein
VLAFPEAKRAAARTVLALAAIILIWFTRPAVPTANAHAATSAHPSDDPEAAVMKEVAAYVGRVAHKSHLENLLVMDFLGPGRLNSMLGRKLAYDLFTDLTADSSVSLVDRKHYVDFISREALLIPDAIQPDPAEWISEQLSAKSFIVGRFDKTEHDLKLYVKIYKSSKPENIHNFTATLPATDAEVSLMSRVLSATGDEEPGAVQKRSSLPFAGKNGYGIPGCVKCRQPEFTPEALKHKAGGTVELVLEINADGQAENIRVVRGLFFGLNNASVEGVKNWIFRPATGPDGKPTAIQQTVEISYKFY